MYHKKTLYLFYVVCLQGCTGCDIGHSYSVLGQKGERLSFGKADVDSGIGYIFAKNEWRNNN